MRLIAAATQSPASPPVANFRLPHKKKNTNKTKRKKTSPYFLFSGEIVFSQEIQHKHPPHHISFSTKKNTRSEPSNGKRSWCSRVYLCVRLGCRGTAEGVLLPHEIALTQQHYVFDVGPSRESHRLDSHHSLADRGCHRQPTMSAAQSFGRPNNHSCNTQSPHFFPFLLYHTASLTSPPLHPLYDYTNT